MRAPDNENKARDAREQWLDNLLTGDREHVQRITEERITAGMYARIVRAGAGRPYHLAPLWRWALISAGAAMIVLVILIERPQTTRPSPAGISPSLTRPATEGSSTMRAGNKGATPPRPRLVGRKTAAQPTRNLVPKQAVFPSDIAPTEEERLLVQLASSHPEQLQQVAQAIVDMDKREKERRQAFEKWLQQGEER